ncbi:MAG TPA: CerR family C-terminal domain-containing protein [Vicinamibacterales bacterium]|nr:CerR family C-terminal domain-containing protein [Vicinamibacterales bacterium]
MRAAVATATRSTHDTETRERLLRAAMRLFGERGLKHVTVREICRAARANVAAVNYHFGDKLGLYREIVQSAIDQMRATNEAARRAGEGGTPEEKLRRYIIIFNQRLMTSGVEELHRVISREMHEPTPALDALVEQGIKPRLDYLLTLVADVLGCDKHDPRVLRCAASIQTQSIAYMPNAVADRIGLRAKLTAAQVDEVAQHIADFSMAGIRAIAASTRIH